MADDWRRRLKPGSYNGKAFEVRSVMKTGAQRYAAHKFVGRSGQEAEPLGAEPTSWTAEAFVIGDNYMAARDALEAELDRPALGVFVDPFRAREFRCIVQTYSVSEGVTEGLGWARFTITIEESSASDMAAPGAAVALHGAEAATANAGAAALAAATTSYEDETTSFTEWAKGSAAAVSEWGDEIDDITSAAFGPLSGTIDALGDLATALSNLEDDLTTLLDTPANLMARLEAVWAIVGSLEVVKAFTRDRSAPAAATAGTPSDQAALDAAAAVRRASLGAAIARQSALTTAADYDSADSARAARDELIATIDAAQAAAGPDEYQAWLDLRAQISSWADAQAARLPELVDITVGQPVPALVLAQRYYQDRDRADDIVARNVATITHPLFASGELEILASEVP